jgi:hypothetical protein
MEQAHDHDHSGDHSHVDEVDVRVRALEPPA